MVDNGWGRGWLTPELLALRAPTDGHNVWRYRGRSEHGHHVYELVPSRDLIGPAQWSVGVSDHVLYETPLMCMKIMLGTAKWGS